MDFSTYSVKDLMERLADVVNSNIVNNGVSDGTITAEDALTYGQEHPEEMLSLNFDYDDPEKIEEFMKKAEKQAEKWGIDLNETEVYKEIDERLNNKENTEEKEDNKLYDDITDKDLEEIEALAESAGIEIEDSPRKIYIAKEHVRSLVDNFLGKLESLDNKVIKFLSNEKRVLQSIDDVKRITANFEFNPENFEASFVAGRIFEGTSKGYSFKEGDSDRERWLKSGLSVGGHVSDWDRELAYLEKYLTNYKDKQLKKNERLLIDKHELKIEEEKYEELKAQVDELKALNTLYHTFKNEKQISYITETDYEKIEVALENVADSRVKEYCEGLYSNINKTYGVNSEEVVDSIEEEFIETDFQGPVVNETSEDINDLEIEKNKEIENIKNSTYIPENMKQSIIDGIEADFAKKQEKSKEEDGLDELREELVSEEQKENDKMLNQLSKYVDRFLDRILPEIQRGMETFMKVCEEKGLENDLKFIEIKDKLETGLLEKLDKAIDNFDKKPSKDSRNVVSHIKNMCAKYGISTKDQSIKFTELLNKQKEKSRKRKEQEDKQKIELEAFNHHKDKFSELLINPNESLFEEAMTMYRQNLHNLTDEHKTILDQMAQGCTKLFESKAVENDKSSEITKTPFDMLKYKVSLIKSDLLGDIDYSRVTALEVDYENYKDSLSMLDRTVIEYDINEIKKQIAKATTKSEEVKKDIGVTLKNAHYDPTSPAYDEFLNYFEENEKNLTSEQKEYFLEEIEKLKSAREEMHAEIDSGIVR